MGRREGLGAGVWGRAERRESWGQTGSAAVWGGGDEDGDGVPLPTSHPSSTHSSNYVRTVCMYVCVCVCVYVDRSGNLRMEGLVRAGLGPRTSLKWNPKQDLSVFWSCGWAKPGAKESLGPRTGCKTDFGPRAFGGSSSNLSPTYPTRSGGSGSG